MNAYRYSTETLEYIGTVSAQKDVQESAIQRKDVWILPAYSTFNKPMECPKGFVPVFNGIDWSMAEDHRGKTGFVRGLPYIIDKIGPLPEGWTEEEQPAIKEPTKQEITEDLALELTNIDIKSIPILRRIILAKARGVSPDINDITLLAGYDADAHYLESKMEETR